MQVPRGYRPVTHRGARAATAGSFRARHRPFQAFISFLAVKPSKRHGRVFAASHLARDRFQGRFRRLSATFELTRASPAPRLSCTREPQLLSCLPAATTCNENEDEGRPHAGCEADPTRLDVAIIGAGVGGLYAVYRLLKLGLKVRALAA